MLVVKDIVIGILKMIVLYLLGINFFRKIAQIFIFTL
jgi:hypothetical protein